MKIFNVVNQVVMPTTEILLISPFKEIWERDLSEHKFYAIKEFTYIEFMCSPKQTNPFYGYTDLVERSLKIKENLYNKEVVHQSIAESWKPDILIEDAIKVYKQFLNEASPSLGFLEAAQTACNGLKNFYNKLDLTEKYKGKPIYKPNDITNGLKQTEATIKSLYNLREKVEQELFENSKTTKDRPINHFEQ